MTKLTLTRAARVFALGAAFAMACAAAPSAGAAPPTGSTPFSPSHSTNNTCQTGSDCTAASTADGDGTHVVSASVSRPDATEHNEYSEAWANGSVRTRAPKGTDPLRVTFTWRVDSTRTAANSTTLGGIAVGRIFADGQLSGCTSCVVESDTNGKDVMVASTFSELGPVPPEKVTLAGSLVSYTFTVNGRNDAPLRAGTKMTLTGWTRAFTYVGGPCYETGCETAAHSGTAAAEAQLQLVSITMRRGDAPDEPVLLDI